VRWLVLAVALLLPLLASGQSSLPDTLPLSGPEVPQQDLEPAASFYAAWSKGPSTDPNDFLIGVWLQHKGFAKFFAGQLGINTMVGVNQGVGNWAAWLADVENAGLDAVVQYSNVRLSETLGTVLDAHRDAMKASDNVVGWIPTFGVMPDDEYDNGATIDPCVEAYTTNAAGQTSLQSNYATARGYDSTRPLVLVPSIGFFFDAWEDRGLTCADDQADYPKYLNIGDITAPNMGAVTQVDSLHTDYADINGVLELYTEGMRRHQYWDGDKAYWQFVEGANLNGPTETMPTYAEQRFEAWTGIINGAKGIVWLCEKQRDSGSNCTSETWDDPDADCRSQDFCFRNATMKANVIALNAEISSLAPVINSQPAARHLGQDIQWVQFYNGASQKSYVFAANKSSSGGVSSTFPAGVDTSIDVLNESRSIAPNAGTTVFQDSFDGYAVHLYEIDGNVGPVDVTCHEADFDNTMIVNPTDFISFIECFGSGYAGNQ
jgi:hypothetical protein